MPQHVAMNVHLPQPVQLLAFAAAAVRGLAEFLSLQYWRLREGRRR
jgi:hypothetical protein